VGGRGEKRGRGEKFGKKSGRIARIIGGETKQDAELIDLTLAKKKGLRAERQRRAKCSREVPGFALAN